MSKSKDEYKKSRRDHFSGQRNQMKRLTKATTKLSGSSKSLAAALNKGRDIMDDIYAAL